MTLPHHHPHRVVISPSLLRASAWQRLAVAGGIVAALWAALWAVMA